MKGHESIKGRNHQARQGTAKGGGSHAHSKGEGGGGPQQRGGGARGSVARPDQDQEDDPHGPLLSHAPRLCDIGSRLPPAGRRLARSRDHHPSVPLGRGDTDHEPRATTPLTRVACPPCCPICGDQRSDHSGPPHLVHRQDRALLCSCALHQVLITVFKNRRRHEPLIPLYFLDYCVMVHCVLHNTPCFYLRVLIKLTPEHD